MSNTVKLIVAITLPLLVGATSGLLFTAAGVDSWYPTIQKPTWNPPKAVFAPVWTALYILMGIAFFLVWKSNADERLKKPAITFFAIQLLLNFFWSFIFFFLHRPGWAFVEITILWVFILFTIITFSRASKLAAWLLVPYISWVSFASILNYTIWEMNAQHI